MSVLRKSYIAQFPVYCSKCLTFLPGSITQLLNFSGKHSAMQHLLHKDSIHNYTPQSIPRQVLIHITECAGATWENEPASFEMAPRGPRTS